MGCRSPLPGSFSADASAMTSLNSSCMSATSPFFCMNFLYLCKEAVKFAFCKGSFDFLPSVSKHQRSTLGQSHVTLKQNKEEYAVCKSGTRVTVSSSQHLLEVYRMIKSVLLDYTWKTALKPWNIGKFILERK